MSELKPCPFCGGNAGMVSGSESISSLNGVDYDSLVQCYGCGVSQSGWAPKQQVIDEWNTRANEWVSVSERLPDKDGRYLVVEDNHYRWVGVCAMRNGKFDIEITHWMPLPDPPK